MDRLVIDDVPGKYSRRLCEQFREDASYAQAVDYGTRSPDPWAGLACVLIAALFFFIVISAPSWWRFFAA